MKKRRSEGRQLESETSAVKRGRRPGDQSEKEDGYGWEVTGGGDGWEETGVNVVV